MREHEQSIITSSGQDNEIRRLTDALDYFSGDLDFYPKGSCNWTIAKIHLKGIRDRLEELGIDDIISPDSLPAEQGNSFNNGKNGSGRPETGEDHDIEGGKNVVIYEKHKIDDGLGEIETRREISRFKGRAK